MISILPCVTTSQLISSLLCRCTEFLSSRLSWWLWFSRIWDSRFYRITAILSQACSWAELAPSVQAKFVSNSLTADATLWLACHRWCVLLAFSTLYIQQSTSNILSNIWNLLFTFWPMCPSVLWWCYSDDKKGIWHPTLNFYEFNFGIMA